MNNENLYKYLDAALDALNGDEPGDIPVPSNTTDELAVAIIETLTGETVTPPRASSNIDKFLRAILDVLQGNEPTDVPVASWNIEKYLHAILEALQEHDNLPTVPSPSWLRDYKLAEILDVIADDRLLPSGYKRVLGFSCDNNVLWKIEGFKLKGSDTIRISFAVNAACNVFGCYQGADATDNYDLYASITSGSKYLRYGDGTYLSYWSSANLGNRFDVVFTPTGTQGMPEDSTWTEKSFTSANDMLIGATTLTGSSAKLKGKLFGNIIVDGRLHLIPCERLSDHVLGYYDTVTKTFYEPTGDGAVSLGYA